MVAGSACVGGAAGSASALAADAAGCSCCWCCSCCLCCLMAFAGIGGVYVSWTLLIYALVLWRLVVPLWCWCCCWYMLALVVPLVLLASSCSIGIQSRSLCLALSRPIRSRDVEPRNVPLCWCTLCHWEVVSTILFFGLSAHLCASTNDNSYAFDLCWPTLCHCEVILRILLLDWMSRCVRKVTLMFRTFLELCWSTLCHREMTLTILLFVSNVPLCAMYRWIFVYFWNFADRRCAFGKWHSEFFFLDWMSHCAQCIVHFSYSSWTFLKCPCPWGSARCALTFPELHWLYLKWPCPWGALTLPEVHWLSVCACTKMTKMQSAHHFRFWNERCFGVVSGSLVGRFEWGVQNKAETFKCN